MTAKYRTVGKSHKKLDSLALATGEIKYVADRELENPIELAFLYSTHPHARIISIDTEEAEKIDGVLGIFHHGNTERVLHTTAGQGFPEPSPYDTALFNKTMRYVGDRVAMVAAESKEIANRAISKIKVEYKKLPTNFEMEDSQNKDSFQIHESNKKMPIPVMYKPEKNIAAGVDIEFGELEKGFEDADYIIEDSYRLQQTSHCALEPHAAQAYHDERGRLVIVTTTQVPFHCRRITSHVLGIPISQIRVVKPRIGGGFGGKQEVILGPLVAMVANKFKRPVRYIFSREEVFWAGRTRNPMRVALKTGFKRDGTITALEMDALLNTGAYGSHALTVLSNAGAKVLPLLNKIENMKFKGRSVYTNLPIGGAYRGYGATKGYFALNSHIDMICRKIDTDPLEWIKKWHIKEGETSEVFKALGEGKEGVAQLINSCKLDECIDIGAKEIGWDEKRGKKIREGDKITGIGFAVSMQGSGIPQIDMAAANIKMNEDGSFNLYVGATDIGTGSDTVLAQIAAEEIGVSHDKMIVLSSDTDLTPFDVGAYASSTTYVSGTAVKKCAAKIREQIERYAKMIMEDESADIQIDGDIIRDKNSGKEIKLSDIGYYSLYTHDQSQIQAVASNYGTESPPPFLAAFAEVLVDVKTGEVEVKKFVSAVDCGQAINPVLAEGQVDGAALNGISYALTENYEFTDNGKMKNDSFWDYKIYTTKDMPKLKSFIVESHEKSGPFGAKSVGEIGINGPIPAIHNAIYDAIGIRIYETPFTPEKVYNAIKKAGIK